MSISDKEKEVAAVGISVAAGCKPCTDFHLKAARKAGADESEIKQAVSDALSVRASATAIMGDYAMAQGAGAAPVDSAQTDHEMSRMKQLVCVGAAFAVNCVSTLEKHLALAKSSGISTDEIVELAKLAAFIKQMAASHVERLCGISKPKGRIES